MRNGDNNFNNGHGYEFVSYIYGELDQAARETFESHLAVCDECAMELAAYSDARLGVIEWRREEFDHLETPAIVVPWANEKQAIESIEAEPAGLITRFIEALASFPMFAKAGMGLAAAALVIGVFYFAAYSPATKRAEVAANSRPESQALTPSDTNETNKDESRFIAGSNLKKEAPEMKNTVDRPENTRRPVIAARVNSQPSVRRNELATTNRVTVTTTTTKKAPRLTSVEEDDDKSLRLADLFAEIGSSEE